MLYLIWITNFLDQVAAAWHNRAIAIKLMAFASIGILNTAIDVSAFTVAYRFLDMPLILANVLSWLIAVSGSYAMNTKITFGRETGGTFSYKRYLRFIASGVLGVIVATASLVFALQFTDIFSAKLFSIVAAFAVNFSMSHFVVFRAAIPDPRSV
jgi:putative flippase GtrA